MEQYWFSLFTWKEWKAFVEAGRTEAGFKLARWPTAQKIRPQDMILCYLTGLSRVMGLLEVIGEARLEGIDDKAVKGMQMEFERRAVLKARFPFPCKVPVRSVITLSPETAVPIKILLENMASLGNYAPRSLNGLVSGSPNKWTSIEGEIAAKALLDAAENPVVRPFDPSKLEYESKK